MLEHLPAWSGERKIYHSAHKPLADTLEASIHRRNLTLVAALCCLAPYLSPEPQDKRFSLLWIVLHVEFRYNLSLHGHYGNLVGINLDTNALQSISLFIQDQFVALCKA